MYLELAEDNSNYIPVDTTAGTMYVRSDLMGEDVTLSAKGKAKALITKAAPVVKKVAGAAIKTAPLFIPGGAAVTAAGKIATSPAAKAALQKITAAAKKGAPALKALRPVAAKVAAMPEAASAAIPAAIVAKEAESAAIEVTTKQNFFQRYKWPILIGSGVLLAGGIFLATRKKRK